MDTGATTLAWLVGSFWHIEIRYQFSTLCQHFIHKMCSRVGGRPVDNYGSIDKICMTNEQLWKAALDQLELKISQGNYLTWFRQAKITGRQASEVVIETASPFAYEWLSKKYRSLILEALQSLDKSVVSVKFAITSRPSMQRAVGKKNLHLLVQKNRPVVSSPLPQPVPTPVPSIALSLSRGQVQQPGSLTLNPKYIFSTFVIGTSNEIAHAACQAVADRPGLAYNPLFIYGGVGLGKTHLLQAVGNAVLAQGPHKKVLYVSSERFMNEFVEAIREQKTQQFRKRYRDADVLIIDDIQFLAGKTKTQEELFHTFNALHGQNKQVILSSDRPPAAIPTLQERLSSRLAGGMIVDIKRPDYETRLAILEEKAQTRGVQVDSDALEFIAKNIQNNVRELEGALNRVLGHSEVHNERVTLEYTKKVLADLLEKTQRRAIDARQIIDTVSVYYNLPTDDLCGKCRKKEIVRPRQVAMYLLRKESSMSFPSIGEYFGGRDHTTAMHACEKIEKLLEHDDELSQEISFLRERLYA